MEKLAGLKYWESIVGYIIIGFVALCQIVVFAVGYYTDHDTPLQKIIKKLKRKKDAKK